MKKKLLFYEKDKFDEFVKKFQEKEIKVYPISFFTNQNIALEYTRVEGVKDFVVDITTMVMSALSRNELRIMYESWINALNDDNEGNIDYCVEKNI